MFWLREARPTPEAHCISTLTDASLLTPAGLLWECVHACELSLFQGIWSTLRSWVDACCNQYLASNTILHILSNVWVKSFLFLFIVRPVTRLGFIKETEHHNKPYYQPVGIHWEPMIAQLFFFILCTLFCPSPSEDLCLFLFPVPTDYWWADFTTQWCGARTVEYAMC